MAHYDTVLDVGYDYGADGGLAWDTQIIAFPNGRTRRNMRRSRPLGQWQLGNRDVDAATYEQLAGFFHAMRGRAHSFLYKDWNDYRADEESLVHDNDDTIQLIKTYGLSINGWIRGITKPKASTFVLEMNMGGGWEELEAGSDYTLNDSTGVVTLLGDPPDTSDLFRWSGEFYVPVRFDRDEFTAQFIGYEERDAEQRHAYSLGGLAVVEEPDPEDPE